MEELAVAATRFALDVALKATVLLGLTALALVALSRASAAVRQLVAALALAGALALPGVTLLAPAWELPLLPTPLPELRVQAVSAELAPAERSASARPGIESDSRSRSIDAREPEGAPAGADSSSDAGLAGATAVERSATDFPAPANAFRGLSAPEWMTLGLALWSLGVLFGLSRLAIGTWRVRRIRRHATADPDEGRDALVAALCATMGLRRPVDVLFSADLAVPVTAGLARPVVLLPEGARRWNDERIRVVLLHELAHVRRGDWVSLLVAHVATAVYWFHPLAWSVRSSMRKDCERACDDLVLSSGTRASVYAAHLLSIIRSLRLSNQKALPAVAMARRSYWDGRMRAILDPGIERKNVSAGQARVAAAALVAAVGALAVLAPWAPGRAEAVSSDQSPFYEALSAGGSGQSKDATGERREDEKKDCDSDSGTEPAVIRDEKPRPEKASRVQVAVSHMIDALRGVTPPVPARAAEAAEAPEAVEKATGFVKAGRKNKGGSSYARGMDLHNDGRYDEAIAAFERSIAEGERVEAATYNIACGYALKGDHDRAFEWLEKAVEADFDVTSYLEHDDDLDSLRSDPRYARFRTAARAKKIEDKRDEAGKLAAKYERLRASSPKSGSGFYELGKGLLDVGRYDLSAQAFQNAAARGYKEDVSLYNAACAFSLAGNRSQALDYLHKSLEAGYDDPRHIRKDEDLDNVRGEARYRELLKMADDLELHRFDDDHSHKFWRHPSRRSEARVEAWREVEQHFADYTRRHPQSGRAWFNLGYARIEAERPAEAAEAFRRSLDLGYRKPTTMYNIACAYALQDRRDEAFAWLNKAMDSGFHGAGMLRSDDDLDNLRGDARFRQALARAKADDHEDDDSD